MKNILISLLLLLTISSNAQKMSYDEWKTEAKTNIRLFPKYNNASKSQNQIEADENFIKNAIKEQGNKEKASEYYVGSGFEYLYSGDLQTAMYRFNQAWLLNNNNENVFWGFGAVYFTFKDYDRALEQYEAGLKINPKSSNLLTDKASIYMARYEQTENIQNIHMAIEVFKTSLSIDSKNQNTLYKLSICYFYIQDCKNALKYYDECEKLGGKPISENYSKALKQSCKKA